MSDQHSENSPIKLDITNVSLGDECKHNEWSKFSSSLNDFGFENILAQRMIRRN